MKEIPILRVPILLASASPRRKFLLQEAGFKLRVLPANIEETFPENMPFQEVPVYLSKKKATALLSSLNAKEIILAADSIVVLKNEVLGKPDNRDEAVTMLNSLSNTSHLVITGVSLMNLEKALSFSATSEVRFNSLSMEEIEYYVDHFHPWDKAGSYGIQEWIGWCKIKEIQGSYSNIMGLPMALVYEKLQEFVAEYGSS
ncbi:MAG: septum formation protein Maf [Saprospiraceae bacterium]|nr:septum formation protein Maf [Saprospiraceae bacterium]